MCHEFNQNGAHGTACSAGLVLMPAHLLLASSPNIVACFVLQQSNPKCFVAKLLTWHKAGYEIHHMMCRTNVLCVKAPPQQLLVSAAQLKNIHVRSIEHATIT